MTAQALRFATAILLILDVAGCSGAPYDSTLDTVFDPCAGLVVSSPHATEEQLASIDRALDLWLSVGAFSLSRDPSLGWPTVEMRFDAAPHAQLGVYDDERGIIFINRDISDVRARMITIAHELGHAFGLWHVSGVASLMNEHNISTGPTLLDVEHVYGAWPSCSNTDLMHDDSN